MKKATISDVATLAGVSIKTVSRVANNEANVRDETRRKVHRAIETLDYQPDEHARRLASRRRSPVADPGAAPVSTRSEGSASPGSLPVFAGNSDPLSIDWD
jgi:transcriptional regulator with XRE-family HTH domain